MKFKPAFALAMFNVTLGLISVQAATPATVPVETATTRPASPAVLPGRGLAEHDFFYAGESRNRRMFIIRQGQVVWSYDDPTGRGEISDAVLLSNGNVLFAHQFAVQLISPAKKVLWNYDVPKGYEVHTAVPIGLGHVLYIQNGPEPVLRVVDIVTGANAIEFPLQARTPRSTHGQFRHARITAAGTVVVAHMDLGKVVEYDSAGKALWSIDAPGVWGANPLPDGHLLITDRKGVHEVDRDRKTIWEVTPSDVPDYKLPSLQLAWRLPNGNTLFNTWANEWGGKIDHASAPVQAIEVTPDKKVVWALRAWTPPVDLGPATTIQVLDQPSAPERSGRMPI